MSKVHYKLSVCLLVLTSILYSSLELSAQNTWTEKDTFPGGFRQSHVGYGVDTDNNGSTDKAYAGFGWDLFVSQKDWYEYDPANGQWTAKDTLPGEARRGPGGFAIGNKVYLGLGIKPIAGGPSFVDFWEYNTSNDTWTQVGNFPGLPRWGAVGVSVSGYGYLFGGNSSALSSSNSLTELWRYDPVNDSWLQLTSKPGNGAQWSGIFTLDRSGNNVDDHIYVVGGGSNGAFLNEVWEYNIQTDTWTQKNDFPNGGISYPSVFSFSNRGFVGGGQDNSTSKKEFYEYNPDTDNWDVVASIPLTNGIVGAAGFDIGNKGYVLGGKDINNGRFSSLWEFTPPLSNDTANHIRGRAYIDEDNTCSYGGSDFAVDGWIIRADPGPYYALTNANGEYDLRVPSGTYTVTEIVPQLVSHLIDNVCLSNGISSYSATFNSTQADTTGFDFANQTKDCRLLQVQIASDFRRRCFENTTVVNYCNEGFDIATNVKVHVRFPELVDLVSADFVYTIDTSDGDTVYVFDIGTLAPFECGTIHIVDIVKCRTVDDLGLIQCTEAWITPPNVCPPAQNPNWNQANVAVEGICDEAGYVILTVSNTGTGDMTDSVDYDIFLDSSLVYQGKVKLDAGEDLVIQIPATGHTVRIVVDQVAGHPQNTFVTTFVEGCANPFAITISTGFVNDFPVGNETVERDEDCLPIIGSYDPNDKQVYPNGISVENFVQPNTTLSYQIRFQNTGSDTAINVLITDTISPDLDLSTLLLGPSSHEYNFDITSYQGKTVLKFDFPNINLPDTNTNLLASRGFVKISMDALPNTPLGTQIDNEAQIYFDFNPPITTNNAFVTLSDTTFEDSNLLDTIVFNPVLSIPTPGYYSAQPSLYPNPNNGRFILSINNINGRAVQWSVIDVTGKLQLASKEYSYTTANVFMEEINLSTISPGIYLVQVWVGDEKHLLKWVKH